MDRSWCHWCRIPVANLLDHVIEHHAKKVGIPTEWPDGAPIEPVNFDDIKDLFD